MFAITVASLVLLVSTAFEDAYDKKTLEIQYVQLALPRKVLRANILFAYRIDKALELTNNFLELLVLEMLD